MASVLPGCRSTCRWCRCGSSACSTASRVPEPSSRSSLALLAYVCVVTLGLSALLQQG